jgi:hypothetical protein
MNTIRWFLPYGGFFILYSLFKLEFTKKLVLWKSPFGRASRSHFWHSQKVEKIGPVNFSPTLKKSYSGKP